MPNSSNTAKTQLYDEQEQSSTPLPPQMRSSPNQGLAWQSSSARTLFSLDPNVGVAVNLSSNTPYLGNHSQQLRQHIQQQQPEQSKFGRQLFTVPERPPQMKTDHFFSDINVHEQPFPWTDIKVSNSKARIPETRSNELRSQMDNKQRHANAVSNNLPETHDKSTINPNTAHPSLEYPPLYFIVKQWSWLHEAIKPLYSWRWRVSYPLQRRVPWSQALEKLGIYFTYGELLLVLPFFILVVVGMAKSFLHPSPSITGRVSRLPLIFAFATATHNSFVTLLLGMPFERALWYHKLAGRIAFFNGLLHTYVWYVTPDDDLSIVTVPSGSYANVSFGPYLTYDKENSSGTALLIIIISSSPGQKIVSFHIRKAGEWTAALHNLAQTRDEVSILLEGPYGSVGVDLMSDRYRSVLLVSGGIGITPMQSICNQLVYEHSTGKRNLKQLSFVWMERDPMVMSDVDVVRRTGNMHLFKTGLDAISRKYDDDDDDAPLDIATTILSLVPPPAATNSMDKRNAMAEATNNTEKRDVTNEYADWCPEGTKEDFSVVSIHNDAREMCEMSLLSDEPTLMEQGRSHLKAGERQTDDDTFWGAAFHGAATRSPIDVLDMQVYLTSKDVKPGVGDLPFVFQGRPKMDRIFMKLREGAIASGERRVAVCVCAPLKIVNICQSACIKHSDAQVYFEFHSETFG